MRKHFYFIFIIWVYFHPAFSADFDPKSERGFYINSFSQVSSQEFPLSSRAVNVYSKLLSVSNNLHSNSPELIIVNSKSWPWAIALPDNSIVVTVGAIEICYKNVSVDHGDIRLAMLLGHELAHLAQDDYWHRDVYLALTDQSEQVENEMLQFIGKRSGLLSSDKWSEIVTDRELKADDRGAVFAVLAGFDIRELFRLQQESFFQFWAEQIASKQNQIYFSADERTRYLRQRLDSLAKSHELFEIGLALIAMGNLKQAEVLFKLILNFFPAHEVYNNLAYIKLNQSNIQLSHKNDNQFWLPIQVDFNPKTPILLRGNTRPYVDKEALQASLNYFEQAVSTAPTYLKGLLNLSSAYILAKKYNKAAAILDEADGVDNTDPSVELLQSLVLYLNLSSKVKINDYVYSQHKKILDMNASLFMANFNLAQLYQRDQKPELARPLWKKLANNINEIPAVYRKVITDQLKLSLQPPSEVHLPALLDLHGIELVLNNSEVVKKQLWNGNSNFQIAKTRDTKRVFFNDELLFASLKISKNALMEVLQQCCLQAKKTYTSIIGDLIIYEQGVAAFHSNKPGESRLILSRSVIEKVKTLR